MNRRELILNAVAAALTLPVVKTLPALMPPSPVWPPLLTPELMSPDQLRTLGLPTLRTCPDEAWEDLLRVMDPVTHNGVERDAVDRAVDNVWHEAIADMLTARGYEQYDAASGFVFMRTREALL